MAPGTTTRKTPTLKIRRLALYSLQCGLDELDNRTKEQGSLISNGFTEPTLINDFPIRDRKVVLHIRRRRWLDAEGHNVVLNVYNLATKGTRYSEEFAAFLKERLGYLPSDGTFAGVVLQG